MVKKIAAALVAVSLVFTLSACDEEYNNGYEKGYDAGYSDGVSDGYEEGYSEYDIDEVTSEAKADGMMEAYDNAKSKIGDMIWKLERECSNYAGLTPEEALITIDDIAAGEDVTNEELTQAINSLYHFYEYFYIGSHDEYMDTWFD